MPYFSSSSPSIALRRRTAAAACAVLAFFAASRSTRAEAPAAAADAPKYLRYAEAGDNVAKQLQTSIVHFVNKDGVHVDLIGAVHVADASYYADLNKRFKDYDAVLYEMVKPKDMQGVHLEGRAPSMVSMLQRFMQDQLDLTYQLDKVDYQATNFVHADLTAEDFAQKQEERGESMTSLMISQMLRELNKAQDPNNAGGEMGIMDLVQALQSPDRSRQLKLVLAHEFANMDDAMSGLGDGGGTVIVDERNKHALEVLKNEIDGGKKHLAIFYGAAHLKGMESLMTGLMGFKQVGDPEWLVAWDLTDKRDLPAPPAPAAVEPGGSSHVAPATTEPK